MKASKRWYVLGAAALVGLVIYGVVSNRMADPSFAFLSGQKPIWEEIQETGWKMAGPRSTPRGYYFDDGPAMRWRKKEYVFPASYPDVVRTAEAEFRRLGGKENPKSAVKLWLIPGGTSVLISKGNYNPETGIVDPGAPFVRVTVETGMSENLVGCGLRWLRSALPRSK